MLALIDIKLVFLNTVVLQACCKYVASARPFGYTFSHWGCVAKGKVMTQATKGTSSVHRLADVLLGAFAGAVGAVYAASVAFARKGQHERDDLLQRLIELEARSQRDREQLLKLVTEYQIELRELHAKQGTPMQDYTLDSLDPEFAAELRAWDALSDEAFAKYELGDELPHGEG